MTINQYFDQYTFLGEQNLLKSLGQEMIQQRGIDVFYMPRSHVNIDALWLEDTLSQFTQATTIEVYIKNFMGYQGEGDMFSKFGLSMADQITFSMMRHRWDEEFTQYQPELIRPLEGDFIYLPMTHAIFEVKFVEHESNFYTSGHLTYYDIKCERVNYSNENISTGIESIDNIATKFKFAEDTFLLLDDSGEAVNATAYAEVANASVSSLPTVDPITQNNLFTNDGVSFIQKSSNPLGG